MSGFNVRVGNVYACGYVGPPDGSGFVLVSIAPPKEAVFKTREKATEYAAAMRRAFKTSSTNVVVIPFRKKRKS